MKPIFADRINDVPRSFIRDILKVAISQDIISFAGGLPNRELFPVSELKEASAHVFDKHGKEALQYAPSEGYLPLREYISNYYKTFKNLEVDVKNIIITSGSQQGLDLLGKIFLNDHEQILIEEPGYLGAIQAFSMFRPNFLQIPLQSDGPNLDILESILKDNNPRLFYTVPNFQNPSGLSYSLKKRKHIATLLKVKETFIIEDDPYEQLRFRGENIPGFATFIPEKTIMLGTFSKTVVPSFRIGWIVAPEEIMEKLEIAKQAADLHTNYFSQMVLSEYLLNHQPEKHIETIKEVYGNQCKAMVESIKKHFPKEVHFTEPEGGMFLWVTLPEGFSSLKLFEEAIKRNVAFVPGNPFYINKENTPTLRLNFSCVDKKTIDMGIERLGLAIQNIL